MSQQGPSARSHAASRSAAPGAYGHRRSRSASSTRPRIRDLFEGGESGSLAARCGLDPSAAVVFPVESETPQVTFANAGAPRGAVPRRVHRRSHVPGVGWPVLTGPRSEPPLSREGPHPAWHRTPWPRRLDRTPAPPPVEAPPHRHDGPGPRAVGGPVRPRSTTR
jgi:hypothetical protein